MPSQCSICNSPKRAALESLVASGESLRSAARGLGLSYEAAKRHRRDHSGSVARGDPSATYADSAVDTFRMAFDAEPMPHQVEYLTETRDLLVLKGRQVGCTTAGAALALHVARSGVGKLAVIVSPTMKQSSEVVDRARVGVIRLGDRLVQDSATTVRFRNGSRIVSLPGNSRAVRGYAADLLVIDESAFVADETFAAARAVVAATHGRVVVQSTPGLPSGWFWDAWVNGGGDWARIHVSSEEVPTISGDFLAKERRSMSDAEYANEYLGQFTTAAHLGRWFTQAAYDERVNDSFPALSVDIPHAEESS